MYAPLTTTTTNTTTRMQSYLEVVFAVNREPCAENVADDDDVRFGVVDGDAVHAQVLRQQGVSMSLHNVLNTAYH